LRAAILAGMIASVPRASFRIGVALVLALLASRGAAQVAYSVTDIGVLGPGPISQAAAINNLGQVVGVSDTGGSNTPHAFLYSNGTLTDLGTFAGGGPPATLPRSTTPAGSSASRARPHRPTGLAPRPPRRIIDLGTLASGTQSDGRAIASNGIIVGQVTLNGVGEGRAFYYSGGVMTNFGDPSTSGGLTSNANGVNVVGGQTVIVGYTDHVVGGNTIIDAFTYTIGGGSMTVIGNLGGSIANTISKANAINSAGVVVGKVRSACSTPSSTLSATRSAARWSISGRSVATAAPPRRSTAPA